MKKSTARQDGPSNFPKLLPAGTVRLHTGSNVMAGRQKLVRFYAVKLRAARFFCSARLKRARGYGKIYAEKFYAGGGTCDLRDPAAG